MQTKIGGFQFGSMLTNCQSTKFKSQPIFLTIRVHFCIHVCPRYFLRCLLASMTMSHPNLHMLGSVGWIERFMQLLEKTSSAAFTILVLLIRIKGFGGKAWISAEIFTLFRPISQFQSQLACVFWSLASFKPDCPACFKMGHHVPTIVNQVSPF